MPPVLKDLDVLDKKIIHELQEDARRSYKLIAEKLGVSESTVSNRVNRLTQSGVLCLQARVNPFRLPHRVAALVAITLARRSHEETMREIENLPGVTAVWNTTGKYDLFLEVLADSIEELNNFIFTEGLSKTKGVAHTESFIILSSNTKFMKMP